GERGLIGSLLRVVYAELGLPPPVLPEVTLPPTRRVVVLTSPHDSSTSTSTSTSSPDASSTASLDAGTVRQALRLLATPVKLEGHRWPRGASPAEWADSVRATLTAAADAAFTDAPADQLLREVLDAGYLDGVATHDAAARRLHLSRSAYFRKLSEA